MRYLRPLEAEKEGGGRGMEARKERCKPANGKTGRPNDGRGRGGGGRERERKMEREGEGNKMCVLGVL